MHFGKSTHGGKKKKLLGLYLCLPLQLSVVQGRKTSRCQKNYDFLTRPLCAIWKLLGLSGIPRSIIYSDLRFKLAVSLFFPRPSWPPSFFPCLLRIKNPPRLLKIWLETQWSHLSCQIHLFALTLSTVTQTHTNIKKTSSNSLCPPSLFFPSFISRYKQQLRTGALIHPTSPFSNLALMSWLREKVKRRCACICALAFTL